MRGCGKAEILFRNHFSISILHTSCHLGFAMPRFSAASKQKWGGIRRPNPMSGKTGRENPTLPVSNIKRGVGVLWGVVGTGQSCRSVSTVTELKRSTQRKQNQCFSVAISNAVSENRDILLHENHNRSNKCSFWNSPPVINVIFCPHLFFCLFGPWTLRGSCFATHPSPWSWQSCCLGLTDCLLASCEKKKNVLAVSGQEEKSYLIKWNPTMVRSPPRKFI